MRNYGLRTLLNGTLLPAPHIGRRNLDAMRSIQDQGFEIGIHCYDHYRWQDFVQVMPLHSIEEKFMRARMEFSVS